MPSVASSYPGINLNGSEKNSRENGMRPREGCQEINQHSLL